MTIESIDALNGLLIRMGSDERVQYGVPHEWAIVSAFAIVLNRIEILERKIDTLSADRTPVADGPCQIR